MALEPLHEACFRLGARVAPLYVPDDAKRAYLVGSAVPVWYGRRAFLITAAHVLRGAAGRPLFTFDDRQTVPLLGGSLAIDHIDGRTIDGDLAVIPLPDEQAHAMGNEFVFTYAEDFGDVTEPDQFTWYAWVGYPHSRNAPKPRKFTKLEAKPTYVALREHGDLAHPKVVAKHPSYHFALYAPDGRETDFSGRRYQLPHLRGMSGGGVWRIDVDPRTGEILDPVLAGFGIEHIREREGVVVATRAAVGGALIARFLDESGTLLS